MINATLIVQAGNFFVGYLILKYIVLKPALRLIRKQEQERHVLDHDIVTIRQHADEKQACMDREWRFQCKAWSIEKPVIDPWAVSIKKLPSIRTPFFIDADQEHALIDTFKKEIVDRVGRV